MVELTREEIRESHNRFSRDDDIQGISVCGMAFAAQERGERIEHLEQLIEGMRETRQQEVQATEEWRRRAEEAEAETAQMRAQCGKLRLALEDANGLCRSAHAIAEREGATTNWMSFQTRLQESLERQHQLLHPGSPNDGHHGAWKKGDHVELETDGAADEGPCTGTIRWVLDGLACIQLPDRFIHLYESDLALKRVSRNALTGKPLWIFA